MSNVNPFLCIQEYGSSKHVHTIPYKIAEEIIDVGTFEDGIQTK